MTTMYPHTTQDTQCFSLAVSPLKYQRLLRGWSQMELAQHIANLCLRDGQRQEEVNVNLISRWELGKNLPAFRYRRHLCEIFGMNTQELGILGEKAHSPQSKSRRKTKPQATHGITSPSSDNVATQQANGR